MTLEDRAQEWLDTHVSDTEGRDDIVRSLTDLLREVRTAGMLEAAEKAKRYAAGGNIIMHNFATTLHNTAAGSKPSGVSAPFCTM